LQAGRRPHRGKPIGPPEMVPGYRDRPGVASASRS